MATGIRKAKRQAGCGFLIVTCLVTCILLVVNSALMIVIIRAHGVPNGPSWLKQEEVLQAILFAGPLVLVFVEWAIFDWLIELSSPASQRIDNVTKEEDET